MSTRCDECYYCYNVFDSFRVFYCSHSRNCSDSYYLKNCVNCKYCYNCENLSHKSYCIENKQYSENEYFEKLTGYKKVFESDVYYHISSDIPQVYMKSQMSEHVSGDHIFNSKNVQNSYHVKNLENGRFCSFLSSSSKTSMDCYDYDYFG